jgi:hypothetical protein
MLLPSGSAVEGSFIGYVPTVLLTIHGPSIEASLRAYYPMLDMMIDSGDDYRGEGSRPERPVPLAGAVGISGGTA